MTAKEITARLKEWLKQDIKCCRGSQEFNEGFLQGYELSRSVVAAILMMNEREIKAKAKRKRRANTTTNIHVHSYK